LQWSFVGADPVDLDASCVAMGRNGECLDVIFFNNLVCEGTKGPYMRHSGDNTTGEDDGVEDDEEMKFVFENVPDDVEYLMVSVTSYTGADFTLVDHAACNVINTATQERLCTFSLGLIGAHTATLLCCMSRVAPTATDPNTYWDLRELNLPTSGSTFAEVLTFMQELLLIPKEEQDALQRLLPDYSVVKDPAHRSQYVAPSVMKFAIGWDGENDLDAFAVMLNEHDEYVDHVYAKHGKVSSSEGAAKHSGDKLNGFAGDGDDEFVDINVNSLRKDVHRVFFLVSLHSGFSKTLGDVPKCYCRMQNKRPTEPFMEVDRMNISRRGGKERTLVLSMLVRKDSCRFEYIRLHEATTLGQGDYIEVLPWLRLISSFFTSRIRELSPAHPPNYFSSALSNNSISTTGASFKGASAVSLGQSQPLVPGGPQTPTHAPPKLTGRLQSMRLLRSSGASEAAEPNSPGTDHPPEGDEMKLQVHWDEEWEKVRAEFTVPTYGIEIIPMRVQGLGPLEPHHFACHVEVWVCDRKCRDKAKTSICTDRACVEWSTEDPKNRCRFVVRRYDRIRLLVFEHSVAGYADLELFDISEAFFKGEDVVLTVPLQGKEATGNLTFMCRHIPLEYTQASEPSWIKKYICNVM
jgi:stress response protein SCP2